MDFLRCLAVGLILGWPVWASAAAPDARGLDRVTLQLKWKHQFQFAGYYAAIAQGYYRAAGLDVRLVEAQPERDPVENVLQGGAEFGVGTSELLLLRGRGQPVVVLAAIYQHSPLVLLTRKTATIGDLQALHDQPVMIEPQSAELFAYFRNEGIDPARLRIKRHTFEPRDLIEGRVTAMSAYVTDEPFLLKGAGIGYLTFTPRAGGIDFYGDNLFTTETQVRNFPERVRKFREASLRGWDYALIHPQEIIALIRDKYSTRKTAASLTYEAGQTAQLMHPGLIEVGHMNPGRWRHIADTYVEFGMLPHDFKLAGFLYDPNPRPDYAWAYWTIGVLVLAVLAALGWVLPLVRLNRQLQAAKEAAEAADAAKSRYLAFLTHEIRTPLNGLVGMVELMKLDPLPPEQQEQVKLLDHSAQNLLRLVDNVLDHSRLEAGRLEVELGPVVLSDFLSELTGLYASSAQVKGLILRQLLQPGVPAVIYTDALRLHQILANLLSNAIKFTATGEVELKVAPAGDRLRFSVRDTGPGIPPDKAARLFLPYAQGEASVARQFGGSGLGLSISRQLAQMLGGGITLESTPGQGATFILEIAAAPVSDVHTPQA